MARVVNCSLSSSCRSVVILSDRRESKDLGTKLTANDNQMRRFFDSALRAPLRTTDFYGTQEIEKLQFAHQFNTYCIG